MGKHVQIYLLSILANESTISAQMKKKSFSVSSTNDSVQFDDHKGQVTTA